MFIMAFYRYEEYYEAFLSAHFKPDFLIYVSINYGKQKFEIC